MFKVLKDKLKGALGVFSRKAEEEAEEKEIPEEESKKPKEKVPEKKPKKKEKPVPDILEEKEESEGPKEEEPAREAIEKKKAEEKREEAGERPDEEKKGFLGRVVQKVSTVELSEDKFDEMFWPLEMALLENNVALEVVEKVKEDMKQGIAGKRFSRKEMGTKVQDTLKNSIESLFQKQAPDILESIEESGSPYVIAFIGVNGAGKTTTMAKLAHKLMKAGKSVVFAAADTFRAASMEQLQEHADRLGIKTIKHSYESDPAAVAFDAVQHAKAKGIDVVMIDTAGRLHSNRNLMDELKKVIRVNSPDLKVFVGESTTGNDCVEQAREFNEAVGIDAIVLTKADVDEKGGAAISISYVTGKPIIYLGTGQDYDDLEEFSSERIIKELF